MKRNIIYSVIIGLLTLFNISCNDFLTQEPENSLTYSNFLQTEQDCESTLNGLQVQFRNTFKDLNILDRDRAMPFDYLDGFWESSCNNTPEWSPTDPQLNWLNEYKTISNANLLIDNLFRVNLSQERYNFYLGQAKAIRAYTYFYILRVWGDAPLIIKSQDVGEQSRVPCRTIADFCIKEFREVSYLLPSASNLQDASGNLITSKQYFSKESVQAVLAHLYAWLAGFNKETELYHQGILYADSVINSNQYQLLADPEEVCTLGMKGNSCEGIVEIDFRNTYDEIQEAGVCYQSFFQGWPIEKVLTEANPRDWLRFNFSSVNQVYPYKEDKRRYAYFFNIDETSKWSYSITQGAAYINKFRGAVYYSGGAMDGELKGYDDNIVHIRLADIILLRAEMRNKTGNTAGAISDLNRIRQRAGIPDYNVAKDGDLSHAIALERKGELLFEGVSIWFFDNLRNWTLDNLSGEFKTLTSQDIADGALFIPVSEYAFSYNPVMKQTVYWKARGY